MSARTRPNPHVELALTEPAPINADIQQATIESIAHAWASRLKFPPHPRVCPAAPLPYRDYLLTLSPRPFLAVIRDVRTRGMFLIELEPPLIYRLIERLLGGEESEPFVSERPFTSLELDLARIALAALLTELAPCWPGGQLETVALRDDAPALHLVPEDETVYRADLEWRLASRSTRLRLAVPRSTFAPDASRSPSPAQAVLTTHLSANDLRMLQAGDLITLDAPADGDAVTITYDQQTRLRGDLVRLGERRAVRLAHPAPSEPS